MTTVAFPSGYNLERETDFDHNTNTKTDIISGGGVRVRIIAETQYESIGCIMKLLTLTQKNVLVAFLKDNRANTVTWTIDGIDYTGNFVGGFKVTMTGPLYNVSFTYYASVVA